MKIKIIDKWIVVDGRDINLKVIETFYKDDDMFPDVDVYNLDKLTWKQTDSVLIAESLNKYSDRIFSIEYDSEAWYCECCGHFDNTQIHILEEGKVVIENFIDGHLGYNEGLSQEDVINDWDKLGIKVEYVVEE